MRETITVIHDGYEAGSFTTDPISLKSIYAYSVQCVVTGSGSPNGTLTLEASNDKAQFDYGVPPATVSTWTTVSSSSQAITGTGTVFWDVASCGYEWVRVKYTASSGNGTFTVTVKVKGW